MVDIEERIRSCMHSGNANERLSALLSFMKEGAFDVRDIIVHMADTGCVPPDILSELLSDRALFGYRARKIRTVLITVNNLYFGGGPQSTVLLAGSLAAAKDADGLPRFKVILVSDEAPSHKDHELSPSVRRITLPERNPEGSYKDRAAFLADLLEREEIDLVIQGTRRDGDSLWDMLLCKSHSSRPAYIHFFRTSFGSLFLDGSPDHFQRRKRLCQYADALVVLNRSDRIAWGSITPNVWLIPDMINAAPHLPRSGAAGHRVIWAGRIDHQKQPLEIIEIARKAVELLPDIRFDMLGEETGEPLVRMLKERIVSNGLEQHVFVHGYQTNMEKQYSQGDVFCHTALFEGLGLVLYEAAAHALPVVMYKMPGLDYMEHLPAIVECAQKDREQMARAIVGLLTDRSRYAETSSDLVRQFTALSRHNLLDDWLKLFESLEKGMPAACPETAKKDVDNAMEALVFYHYRGMENRNNPGRNRRSAQAPEKALKLLPAKIMRRVRLHFRGG